MTRTPGPSYESLCSRENLLKAFEKARQRKTQKPYVLEFEEHLAERITELQEELTSRAYRPRPLETFIIRDPKTRKISKSDFRDRIVHHAVCNVIEPLFDKQFIHDNYANRKGKGTLNAVLRFNAFKRKVSRNGTRPCYILKADVKHYFETVDHRILLSLLERIIVNPDILALIEHILANHRTAHPGKGMPLGNLTSQFFANVYLNELDQYVKHGLRAPHYIRYVDDFVILAPTRKELEEHKARIDAFLKERLALQLHPDKSRIIALSTGIGFLGFRIFTRHQLLRKKNLRRFERKFRRFKADYALGAVERETVAASIQGWIAYAQHANTYRQRARILAAFDRDFAAIPSPQPKKPTKLERAVRIAHRPFTVQKTLFLFKRGKTPEQIATRRGIKPGTVWSHLANLIEHHQIRLAQVVSREKAQRIGAAIQSQNDTLSAIKARLTDQAITYDEIACVIAHKRAHTGKMRIAALVKWYRRTNCERKCFTDRARIDSCGQNFERLAIANPALSMTKEEFLGFFHDQATVCILPDYLKRRTITKREFLMRRNVWLKEQKKIMT